MITEIKTIGSLHPVTIRYSPSGVLTTEEREDVVEYLKSEIIQLRDFLIQLDLGDLSIAKSKDSVG